MVLGRPLWVAVTLEKQRNSTGDTKQQQQHSLVVSRENNAKLVVIISRHNSACLCEKGKEEDGNVLYSLSLHAL